MHPFRWLTIAILALLLAACSGGAPKDAEVVILAVKPYNYTDILKEIKPLLNPKKHVVVSVITGVWVEQLQKAILFQCRSVSRS